MAGGANETFHFLIVGVPLSPLHSCVSIGQELCLRGHKVTVLSFAERGRQKVEKYSKACKLNYVSLGPLPVDDEHEDALVKKGMSSNSTLHQIENVAKNLLGPYSDALALGVEKYLETAEMPTFGLVSMPFGRVGRLLEQRGLDFAVNMPTILVPPMVPWAAPYVPVPFLGVSVHDMSFLERMLVIGSNWLFNLVRVAALTVGYRFSFMPELGWDLWMGRLVFVNTIPGMDYTQPLPPLVQYTGPVVDVKKMEPFPEDVEQWLEEVPANMPVVYVSFGTVVRLLPDRAQAMLATLTSEEYYTLWALPKPQQVGLPETLPSTVKIHHWVPTTRALAHPKVKAFVSHCGGNSAAESMALGVPLIGYPQFGDQPAVCRRIADAGAGITGPQGGWVQAQDVLHVLRTESYARKAEAMSRLFTQFGGVSRAADLMELGARGDHKLLQMPQERSATTWFLLGGYDLMIYLQLIFLLLVFGCVKCCRRRPSKEKMQ
ncbi:unnamed protein product [Effrenium voratum]|nr:unnamed protein product [Effrenium voratum]